MLARFAQLLQAELASQRPLELGSWLGEQLVLEALVGLVEVEAGGEPLEHVEQRVDAGLDRPLAQQRGREAVDRLDVRPVEVARRRSAAARAPLVCLCGPPLELVAHPGRQLGRGLLGERDHHQLVDASRVRSASRLTTRWTSTVVLPVPAAASTHRFASSSVAIR